MKIEWMKFKFLIIFLFFSLIFSLNQKFLIKQLFNFNGIKFFNKIKFNYKLFQPNNKINKINQINLFQLKNKQIKGLIFDKDNTITKLYDRDINEKIQKFLNFANKV